MESSRKQKFNRFTFILSGTVFTLGGLLLIMDGKLWLGLIQIVAGVFNYSAVALQKRQIQKKLEVMVLIFNILVSVSVAWDYILEQKQYLQYAWLLAAGLSLVAMIITLRKRNNSPTH